MTFELRKVCEKSILVFVALLPEDLYVDKRVTIFVVFVPDGLCSCLALIRASTSIITTCTRVRQSPIVTCCYGAKSMARNGHQVWPPRR